MTKRIGTKLGDDQLIALNGEAGYQADLLMPGLRFKLWPSSRSSATTGCRSRRTTSAWSSPRSATRCPPAPSRRCTSRSSATSPRLRAFLARAAGSAASSARCCRPAPPRRSTRSASSSSPPTAVFGKMVSESTERPSTQVDPNVAQGRPHHAAGRHATSSAWSPRSRARRPATSPAASAGSPT